MKRVKFVRELRGCRGESPRGGMDREVTEGYQTHGNGNEA